MEADPRKFLWVAREAADSIIDFVRGKSSDDYTSDALLRSGVERQFQIIGEAIRQLAHVDPVTAEKIPEFRDIIAFRNIIVHGYALLDDAIVWRAVEQELPKLRAALADLLANE